MPILVRAGVSPQEISRSHTCQACTAYRHTAIIIQFTVYSIPYTVYSIQYTIYNIQHTIYIIQYTVYSIWYTVYCILYTVYCILYSVYMLGKYTTGSLLEYHQSINQGGRTFLAASGHCCFKMLASHTIF